MLTTVLFDLDGTLLPMDQEVFLKDYFSRLARWCAPRGYDAKTLIDTLWSSTYKMIKNDGTHTNREVFWEDFAKFFGQRVYDDEAYFDEFYRTEFQNVRASCGFTPSARELIVALKRKGYRLVLATNPIFPAAATQHRIAWAGLEASDFEHITTYENSCHCKPNPAYFADILAHIGCRAEECLMVGNDTDDDGAAQALGIPVFFLTDCLVNKKERDMSPYLQGGFSELMAYFV